jgi:5-dehydro-2-deoxygluconokinase
MNGIRVYMLAADHRWQWEEWCDAHDVSRNRIAAAKDLARRGFVLARERSPAVRAHGALLMDAEYGADAIAAAAADGVDVGTPAEKAGAFPLAWASEPFSRSLIGNFVKVLVRHRTDHPASVTRAQIDKLLQVQEWCRAAGKPLVVEVLVPRDGESEDAFEAAGRPAMLASFIRGCYDAGVAPAFWKIEGTMSADGARTIDAAVRERPEGRQLILGKAAALEAISAWFAAARQNASAAGFAIGRSIYWEPCVEFLSGRTNEVDAVESICTNYLDVIGAWEA